MKVLRRIAAVMVMMVVSPIVGGNSNKDNIVVVGGDGPRTEMMITENPPKLEDTRDNFLRIDTLFPKPCASLCINGNDDYLISSGVVSGIFSSGDVTCGAMKDELSAATARTNTDCRFLQAAAWAAGTCGCYNYAPLPSHFFPSCPICGGRGVFQDQVLDPFQIAGRNAQDGSLLSCGRLQVLVEFAPPELQRQHCRAYRTSSIQNRCCLPATTGMTNAPLPAPTQPALQPPKLPSAPPTRSPIAAPRPTSSASPIVVESSSSTLPPTKVPTRWPTPTPPSSASPVVSSSSSSSSSPHSTTEPTPWPLRFADLCQDAPKDYPVKMLYRIKNQQQTCADFAAETAQQLHLRELACAQLRTIRQTCPATCQNEAYCANLDICADNRFETFAKPTVFVQTCPWLAKRNERMQQTICHKSPDAQKKCPETCRTCNA